MPFVSPGTKHGELMQVTLTGPGVADTVKWSIGTPPVWVGATGAVKLTVAWAAPPTADTPVGASGLSPTSNERDTVPEFPMPPLPAWKALMVHVPSPTKVRAPAMVTEQTGADAPVATNDTGKPELAVADSVGATAVRDIPGGWLKTIVCGATEFDGPDGGPVPLVFAAVTVKVYAVRSVSPETVHGEAVHVPVSPPGLDVAVNEVAASPVTAGVNPTVATRPSVEADPIVGAFGTAAATAGLAPAIAATATTVPEARRPPI